MTNVLSRWVVLFCVFVLGCFAEAETLVAGWDLSFNIGAGVPEVADHSETDIVATAFWSGQNPARSDRGSGDLTFGTFPGAIASADIVTGSQVIYDTTTIDLTVVNNGTNSFDLSSFHVDVWRAYGGNASKIQLSILSGSDLTTGLVGQSGIIAIQGVGPVAGGNDFSDINLSLSGLEDYTLDAGESAVFRLETVSDAVYVDNLAVSGVEVVPGVEMMVSGWDKSLNIGGGVPQAADYTAGKISATVFWGGQNPARSDRGSGDLTFGTYTGAVESVDTVTGAQIIYDTTYLDFTITNASAMSYELSSFRFDAWRGYAANASTIELSVLAGGGLSEGTAAVSDSLPVRGGAPAVGADYNDIDLSLTNLTDQVLAAGESVVFRLETTSDAIYLDNFAVTGLRVVSGEEESGYAAWADDWGVDIGSEINDYDSDGLSNLYEYGLDGNPTNALDLGVASVFEIVDVEGSNVCSYIHPQLSDPESGLNYFLEVNTDLVDGTWTNVGYMVAGTNVTGDALSFVTNIVDTAEARKFIRLMIQSR